MGNDFVFAFLLLFHFFPGGPYENHCPSGERLHTPREGHDVCIPCPRGTFIAEGHHFFRQCKPCTRIEHPNVEVLVSACNSTQDAIILCTGGFYRRRARHVMEKDRCEKCTECPFPARPCGMYNDTVCCPPNHDAVMTPDGVFVCKKRPIVCGAGQFFRTSSEECLPCPAGTFMSDHNHTYKECLLCEELSKNSLTHAVITRPCSRTAPTLFGCKAGYFRDPTLISMQLEFPCKPCRICNRRLVDCDMFHDAVCSDEDRMVSTAARNLKLPKGSSEVVDMIKQLKATFNEDVHSCILDCMEDEFATLEDSVAQSESSQVKCLLFCIEDVNEGIIYGSLLISSMITVMLVLFNCSNWRTINKLATDNFRKEYSHVRLCAYVVFVLNVVGVILCIVYSLIITNIIKDKGHVSVIIPVFWGIVLILNFVLNYGDPEIKYGCAVL